MSERQLTHHSECWRYHVDCAVREIEALKQDLDTYMRIANDATAEAEALRQLADELIEYHDGLEAERAPIHYLLYRLVKRAKALRS